MDTLNDDCQLRIIQDLRLTDQISLFEAAKEEPTNRWVSNIGYTWQHQPVFSLNCKHFDNFDRKPELLHDFLSIISPTVQEMYLDYISLDNLKCWTKYKFPKMRSLEYILDKDEDCDSKSEESNLFIQIMAKLFHGLSNIKPHGRFDLIHLDNWMNLRKLDLFDCCPVSKTSESAQGIEGLQKLEELIVYRENLSEKHFKMLIRLPNLQSLTFKYSGTDRLRCVIEMRAKEIEKITINGNNFREIPLPKQMTNLRQVTFLDVSDISQEEVQDFVGALPLLERLDIIGSKILSTEIELWQTIDCCPNLKILYISYMNLERGFFSLSRQPMEVALNKRSSPLALYCNDNEHLISLYFTHPNLKVCFDKLPIDSKYYNNIQMHFYPSAMSASKTIDNLLM